MMCHGDKVQSLGRMELRLITSEGQGPNDLKGLLFFFLVHALNNH